MGASVDIFVGRLVGGASSKQGKSTLPGALLGAFVGNVVGRLVGPVVGPLLGQISISPALCVAQS